MLAERAAWLAIVAIAAFLRLWPIGSGFPYIDYIDEGHVLHQAIKVLREGTYDTGLYDYPSQPAYLIVGATVAYAPIYRQLHGRSIWADLPAHSDFHTPLGEAYDLITPPELIVLGRAVVAALSIGTVVLTGLLANAVAGRHAAMCAMLLAAVCPALVSRGSIVIVDTIATFFVLGTLVFCALIYNGIEASRRFVVLAAISAGLAFASKYPAGAVYAAVLVTIVMMRTPAVVKLRRVLLSALAFAITSALAMPALILQPAKMMKTWGYLIGSYDELRSNPGYWGAAISSAELGLPLVAAGLAGIALLVRNRRTVAASWLTFAALLLSALVSSTFQPFRNLLPLVPLICIGAALLIVTARDWILRRFASAQLAATAVIVVLTLALAFSLVRPAWQQIAERTARVDTRIAAIDWLQQHVRPGERILGLRELGIVPAEWQRLASKPTVVSWFDALETLGGEPFDYVITGDPDLRLATDLPGWSEYRGRWTRKLSGMSKEAEFGTEPMFIVPYLWRTNEQRVVVLRAR